MVVCKYCKRDMQTADSCIKVPVKIKHVKKVVKTLDPIPFGKETRFAKYADAEANARVEKWERCHDCNVKKGEFHHPGCDWEECPNCHAQMLMCGGECGGRR